LRSCQRIADRYKCDDEKVRQAMKKVGVSMPKSWKNIF
jgi:hypothetical protein